jgi:hypothetical protein
MQAGTLALLLQLGAPGTVGLVKLGETPKWLSAFHANAPESYTNVLFPS